MKGIILAGGEGTRLNPATKSISKQMLPIYDKPMIYYPMSVLMLSGIRDILIISTPRDINLYKDLFGSGKQLGMNINYAVQDHPNGLAEAFIIGEEFIGTDSVCLILGDNIFYGSGFHGILKNIVKSNTPTIFGCRVSHPERYGVLVFDENNRVKAIDEKPINPKSNYVVPGLYFYDNAVVEIARSIKKSERGELEITAINNAYLKKGNLKVEILNRGIAWLDTGTFESLLDASNFVRTIQKRQYQYIACIEEIAYRSNFISKEQLKKLIEPLKNSEYGKYLTEVSNNP